MSSGSADSDDDVPSTMKSSSLMSFSTRHMLNPCSLAIAPSTITTNKMQVR